MGARYFDLTSHEFKRNPFPTFARMREQGPVVRGKLPLIGEVWLATTYEAVCRVLRDQKNFVRDARKAGKERPGGLPWWVPPMFRVLAQNMLARDGQDHRRLRGLVEQAFLRQSVEEMRPQIESLADRFLDDVERRAEASRYPVDLLRHLARPFPLAVICTLLGLPDEDRPRFTRWAERLTLATSAWGVLFAVPGIWRLLRYFRQQFEACRRQPRPGLISALVEAEQEGDRLSEEELLAMVFLLLLGGHETTVYLISGGVWALLEHPGQKAELLSDWSRVGSAVEEMLRYVSPVQITKPRFVAHDMELYGRPLRRGDFILGVLGSANSDPAQFSEPERFDINRHPNPHVDFGTGIHVCLGLKLARAEAAVALEKLFTRFPHLELGCPASDLQWAGRIGIRALASLPVTLHGPRQQSD